MQKLLILDNIRSLHNVGSLLRTADGCGVAAVFFCGITPYPLLKDDTRLPHISEKATRHIHKTALGAEESLLMQHFTQTEDAIRHAQKEFSATVYGLEQTENSLHPKQVDLPETWAIVVGNEVEGINERVIKACDTMIELPMHGTKESFNVHVAASMVLYDFCLSR